MSRKIPDPLREPLLGALAEGASPWSALSATWEGLPLAQVVWRPLGMGEITREGDYEREGAVWRPGRIGVTVGGDLLVWRPLGVTAGQWYVGSRIAGGVADGSYERPFETVAEALSVIGTSVGVLFDKKTREPLHANDPQHWNWTQYTENQSQLDRQRAEKAQLTAAQELNDKLAELSRTKITAQTLRRDDALEGIDR